MPTSKSKLLAPNQMRFDLTSCSLQRGCADSTQAQTMAYNLNYYAGTIIATYKDNQLTILASTAPKVTAGGIATKPGVSAIASTNPFAQEIAIGLGYGAKAQDVTEMLGVEDYVCQEGASMPSAKTKSLDTPALSKNPDKNASSQLQAIYLTAIAETEGAASIDLDCKNPSGALMEPPALTVKIYNIALVVLQKAKELLGGCLAKASGGR